MLYNYIMELKYYLIIFLFFAIAILLFFLKKTEEFEDKINLDSLIQLNKDLEPDDLKRDVPVMKNFITNVLEDKPTCNVNPIISTNVNEGEADLKIRFLHQYIKLNGLKWALKKINELEN